MDTVTTASTATRPVLSGTEATRRVALLAELKAALDALGVQAVLARNRRLVLRGDGSPLTASGPTDPQLYVFLGDDAEIVTTDGNRYEFTTALPCPIGDPQAAAASLATRLHLDRQRQPR